jgi:peptide/nickel transport system permease protein
LVVLGVVFCPSLLSGVVYTESVLSWSVLGRYTFFIASTLDFPAIMAITLLVAITYLVINLLTDISYAMLDPRVRQ